MPVSLTGTMVDPNRVLQEALAQQQQGLEQAHQETQQAFQQAGQAGQEYLQASQAPPPQLGAWQAFLPTLLSNVASVVGQKPQYAEQTQETLQDKRKALMQTRMQNLEALQGRYNTLAEHAQKLGNVEAEANWRAKAESVSRAHDQVMENLKNEHELAQIKETGRQAQITAGVKASNKDEGIDYAELVKGINAGTIPVPQSRGFTGNYAKLLTEARKQGVDINGINFKQQALTRHYASLNSADQLRLRQAINTTVPSLDVISEYSQALTKAMPRGEVNFLNRANIVAASNGVYGPKARDAARKLLGEISLVRGEVAQVMRGGHAPTNEAFQEVRDVLDGNWSQGGLDAAIVNAKRNMNIRLNAIENTEALVPSVQGGYTPQGQQSGGVTKRWGYDSKGNLVLQQ